MEGCDWLADSKLNTPKMSFYLSVRLNLVRVFPRRGVALVHRPGAFEMSMPDDDQHGLKVQRVRSADVGQLVVTASNQFGSDLCTLQLALAGQNHVIILAFLVGIQRTYYRKADAPAKRAESRLWFELFLNLVGEGSQNLK